MNNFSKLEPIFCKNTGAYLALIADFCSNKNEIKQPYKIKKPKKPLLMDQFSWTSKSSGKLKIRLHEKAELRRNVRSILKRDSTSTNLIINYENSSFVELNSISKNNQEEILALSKNNFCNPHIPNSLIICLLRHKILEAQDIETLYRTSNSYIYKLENCSEFIELGDQIILRNKFSGFMFSISKNLFELFNRKNKVVLEPDNRNNELFLNLCLHGILRQIYE